MTTKNSEQPSYDAPAIIDTVELDVARLAYAGCQGAPAECSDDPLFGNGKVPENSGF